MNLTLHQSEALNLAFAVALLAFAACWVVCWLIELEEPKGKHSVPRYVVEAEFDRQTIKVLRTISQPPPFFFDDEPDWAYLASQWKDPAGTFSALIALQDDQIAA